MLKKINSATLLDDIDIDFKVAAGPGAGKTRWLINHIKNVLQHSTRLQVTRRIACITYTNVAVDTIVKRLGDGAEKVEVSTIHSFLYQHVIKPYLSFIANEFHFSMEKLDGHDDPYVNTKYVKQWVELHSHAGDLAHPFNVNQLTKIPDNTNALVNWLENLKVQLLSNALIFVSDRTKAYSTDKNNKRIQLNRKCLETLEKDFLSYKKLYWAKGILTHDDVLFFSFQLLEQFPFIASILRSKFPYILCDEFQDINPIQKNLLERISQSSTKLGIIGDRYQSIYSFQGAVPTQLDTFFPESVDHYEMEENWRSTNNIVLLLNRIRPDIKQIPKRGVQGMLPTIIVGDKLLAYAKAKSLCHDADVCCLTRENLLANTMRKGVSSTVSKNLVDELFAKDKNPQRPKTVVICLEAIEYAVQGYFKDALKKLHRLESVHEDGEPKRKALQVLKQLMDEEPNLRTEPLMKLYELINQKQIAKLSGFQGSNPKSFYQSITYNDLSTAINDLDEKSLFRTIHKSKGDEFDNVILCFDRKANGDFGEREALDFIVAPNLNLEEQRVKYVAISRARDNLFLSVPSLSSGIEIQLAQMGISILRL